MFILIVFVIMILSDIRMNFFLGLSQYIFNSFGFLLRVIFIFVNILDFNFCKIQDIYCYYVYFLREIEVGGVVNQFCIFRESEFLSEMVMWFWKFIGSLGYVFVERDLGVKLGKVGQVWGKKSRIEQSWWRYGLGIR